MIVQAHDHVRPFRVLAVRSWVWMPWVMDLCFPLVTGCDETNTAIISYPIIFNIWAFRQPSDNLLSAHQSSVRMRIRPAITAAPPLTFVLRGLQPVLHQLLEVLLTIRPPTKSIPYFRPPTN